MPPTLRRNCIRRQSIAIETLPPLPRSPFEFSNHWKHFFQSLEKSQKFFPIIGKLAQLHESFRVLLLTGRRGDGWIEVSPQGSENSCCEQ